MSIYYCVTTIYGLDGTVQATITRSVNQDTCPTDTHRHLRSCDIYCDWKKGYKAALSHKKEIEEKAENWKPLKREE